MPPLAQALLDAPAVATATPSFDEVYQAHARFVWRTLRTFGVAEVQLEDALQDVFVVVHRRLAEFAGRSRVETWLFAIARRVASQYRRASGRAERRQGTEDTAALAAADDTFAALSRAQAAAAVAAILDRMDEDKRVVFALVELEQLAVPEVARLLGLNLNTAYSRLRLARRAFEAAVAQRPEEP
ncbi:MAG TPA: sigma-70 family RNA polymerase sigma factor [Kofleriaceae bacterium]|nr:sigma-70 family RNA polymerase sigma factor [Kofleriaceae bacterium]